MTRALAGSRGRPVEAEEEVIWQRSFVLKKAERKTNASGANHVNQLGSFEPGSPHVCTGATRVFPFGVAILHCRLNTHATCYSFRGGVSDSVSFRRYSCTYTVRILTRVKAQVPLADAVIT